MGDLKCEGPDNAANFGGFDESSMMWKVAQR